jgi:uncharacterized heparinase superfamily protein
MSDWAAAAERMLAWLGIMTHPDGGIVFFNDATFGVAPTFAALARHAEGLGLATRAPTQDAGIRALTDSDHFCLHNDGAVLLFDACPLGPRYLGHGHADTLSFEMSLSGRRLFVNSGTSIYQAGSQRMRERGSAVHNTVIVEAATVPRCGRPSASRAPRGSSTGAGRSPPARSP